MKRFTMTMALLLAVAMPMMAERVTPETAQKVATTFLQNNGAKTTQMVELSKSAGFENLYIFTTESSFVVMSADDCVKPILGYSFEGGFEVEGMPEHVRDWLQGYHEEIQYAADNNMKASSETAILWKNLIEGNDKVGRATTVVDPIIETKWNQNKYYNNLCPSVSDGSNGHAYTGCVATAMAQIMKYHRYPSHGIGSYSYTWNGQTLSANFGETYYDWDNMADYYNYYYENGNDPYAQWIGEDTPERIAAVATLMYHCGVSVQMNYGGNNTGGSSASTAQVVVALRNYFNYSSDIAYREKSNYTDDEWIAMVKNELNAERPLQYRGNSNGMGHSFVCDGYDSNDYFHFNWGWSGNYDGYFSLDNLNTGANNQSGQGNGVYTNNQGAIFGIHPTNCLANDPSNLTYILSGIRDITLNWTAADGASSYNIYRNGNLVGNTTETTFAETSPFGLNTYWVRSADANGELSLSSNTVSVSIDYQTPIVNDLVASLSGNSATLNWTAPDWCFPETESAILNYGIENVRYSWTTEFYGHRHPAENISQYMGMAVYKVSTYIKYPGSYSLYIYTSSTPPESNGYFSASEDNLAVSLTNASVSITNSWYDFELNSPIVLNENEDLWVIIRQENTGQSFPTPSFDLSEHNINAFYRGWFSGSNFILTDNNSSYNCAWLINTYLTDGTYTYNLYQDGTAIVENLSSTTYNATLNDNAANLFSVKTNYYAGETDASNRVGFAKGSASLNGWEMATNDKMTLTEGSTLTVSGNLANTNPANLILENGAQLIHNTDGVKATVKKGITPYTGDNGWNFIASPVMEAITPSEENGFLNGTVGEGNNTYDLYYYYEPEYLWKNYEAETFNLVHKKGYLYANGETEGTTLQFAGTLTPSNNSVTINDLSHNSATLKGFNLVGNPFVCNATVDRDFYVIDNTINEIVLAQQKTVIAPCEGIFVQASENNTNVTFSKANAAKNNPAKESFDIVVAQGFNLKDGPSTGSGTVIDRARVRLGKGTGMEKFSLDDKHSQISLWQDGKYYAVAYTNGATELPLNFKAKQNGTYTLSIEAESLNLDYLHLIDNMTGENTNLLATPNYTFEAKTTDFASRFRLVFSNCEDAVGDNETFAYLSNGNIIVNNEDNATLQIVDAMGRMVASYDGRIQCVPTTGMASGVYVLRLITTNGVKTQKIVIE